MQTPSILQQIASPKAQVNKSSEFNNNNNLKSKNEISSPFKKVLNNEVNNQNKNKTSSSINKNDAANTNKNQKPLNEKKINDNDDQNKPISVTLNNQNILAFVGDIEQLKDTTNIDFFNKEQLLSQDNLQDIQALVPSLQITTDNTPPAPEENVELLDNIPNKGIDLSVKSEKIAGETPLIESSPQEKEWRGKNNLTDANPIEKLASNSIKDTAFSLMSKNETTLLKLNTQTPPVISKNLEIGKASIPTEERDDAKSSKNDGKFTIEAIVKSTPDYANKINSTIKVDLNTQFEAPPIDLKEVPSTNAIPKIEANFANQVGISPDQIKATGIANYIPAQLGTKAWDQAMGQRIIWMVAGGEQSAQLSLNPPDLGPLQIVLKISDNQVDASFISSHLDVRETLESAMPKLRQMMDEAGIQLSGFSVNSQASQSGQNFSQENSSPKTRTFDNSQESNLLIAENTSSKVIKKELGLVDTFV